MVKKRNSFSVETTALNAIATDAVNNYRWDYMICYAWAEFAIGIMKLE